MKDCLKECSVFPKGMSRVSWKLGKEVALSKKNIGILLNTTLELISGLR